MRQNFLVFNAVLLSAGLALTAATLVQTDRGPVEGSTTADGNIRVFKGIPYAAAPVGDKRWTAPETAPAWTEPLRATEFGPRCMQARIYDDMVFRDKGPSEDCLSVNVWTPALEPKTPLPVMVWIYGGGFQAGGSSEPRQDGEALARRGVVVVSLNYRLGIFGFLATKALEAESSTHSAGNYGLMDQTAALGWVQRNISKFGGDPKNVTIFGESAGSFSVSAQMASPLAKDLFAKAIGESGAYFGTTLPPKSLKDSEKEDEAFVRAVGGTSLQALRAMSAQDLLKAVTNAKAGMRFSPNVDGHFLPETAAEIFASGKQAHVPLLAGWNRDEADYRFLLGKQEPTVANYQNAVKERYGSAASKLQEAYPASNTQEVKRAAGALAGDQFIGFSTWNWLEAQAATSDQPLYRYRFDDAPPTKDPDRGAYHSAEIEFVFGTLKFHNLPWRGADRKLSDVMGEYWTNFARSGDPNGKGLPHWPQYRKSDGFQVMFLDDKPSAKPDDLRKRYELIKELSKSSPKS